MLVGHPSLEYIKLWSKNNYRCDEKDDRCLDLFSNIIKNNKCTTFKFGYISIRGMFRDFPLDIEYINKIYSNNIKALKNNYNISKYYTYTGNDNIINNHLSINKTFRILILLFAMKKNIIPKIPITIIKNLIYNKYFNI